MSYNEGDRVVIRLSSPLGPTLMCREIPADTDLIAKLQRRTPFDPADMIDYGTSPRLDSGHSFWLLSVDIEDNEGLGVAFRIVLPETEFFSAGTESIPAPLTTRPEPGLNYRQKET